MAHPFEQKAPLADEQVDDLLDDLELRCGTGVSGARGMTAVRRKVTVTIRPADVQARKSSATTGTTSEMRRQGLSCLTPEPVAVGSVFHLTFDRDQLDLAPLLAICDRCWMLSDSSFEVRFQFAQAVNLPSADPTS